MIFSKLDMKQQICIKVQSISNGTYMFLMMYLAQGFIAGLQAIRLESARRYIGYGN